MKTSNNCLRVVNQNLRLGEKVLKEFKREYPYLKSNSMINVRMKRFQVGMKCVAKRDGVERFAEVNRKWQDLAPMLKGKSVVTGFNIFNMRNSYFLNKNKLDFLTNYMGKEKTANCRECSFVIYDKLKKLGLEPQNVKIEVIDTNLDKVVDNHAFTVFGLSKNADIAKPHSWGKNAVIVDAWSNIVKKSQDALEYMKTLFNPESGEKTFELSKYQNL